MHCVIIYYTNFTFIREIKVTFRYKYKYIHEAYKKYTSVYDNRNDINELRDCKESYRK